MLLKSLFSPFCLPAHTTGPSHLVWSGTIASWGLWLSTGLPSFNPFFARHTDRCFQLANPIIHISVKLFSGSPYPGDKGTDQHGLPGQISPHSLLFSLFSSAAKACLNVLIFTRLFPVNGPLHLLPPLPRTFFHSSLKFPFKCYSPQPPS